MAIINTDIAQKIDIVVRENNSSVINLVIADSSGVAFNLTGYTIAFTVQDNSHNNVISLANGSGIANTTGGSGTLDSTGKISIAISVSNSSINSGTYKHKLVLTKGTSIQTWMYGNFKVNADW
mgnify:FL=1